MSYDWKTLFSRQPIPTQPARLPPFDAAAFREAACRGYKQQGRPDHIAELLAEEDTRFVALLNAAHASDQ